MHNFLKAVSQTLPLSRLASSLKSSFIGLFFHNFADFSEIAHDHLNWTSILSSVRSTNLTLFRSNHLWLLLSEQLVQWQFARSIVELGISVVYLNGEIVIFEVVSKVDIFIFYHTNIWVNFIHHRHQVWVCQSVISFFLDFTLNSLHESVLRQVVSLTGRDFSKISRVSR